MFCGLELYQAVIAGVAVGMLALPAGLGLALALGGEDSSCENPFDVSEKLDKEPPIALAPPSQASFTVRGHFDDYQQVRTPSGRTKSLDAEVTRLLTLNRASSEDLNRRSPGRTGGVHW